MRKASSSFHSFTASVSNLSKTCGSSNLSHLKASDVGILQNAGRSGSPSQLRNYVNDLSATSSSSAPETVDPGGSVIVSHNVQKFFPFNSESYELSRCSMNGFGVRSGVDSRRSYYANPERSSSYRQTAAEAATAHYLHLEGYHREYSTFESLDLSDQTTGKEERAATKMPFTDTLLSSPGAISADVETKRLFIADTNHHRIIIADEEGQIVDCIGSSSGREDGTFETAKLCYPASAVFDADRNFLYIADSENYVIRKADLSTRTLSTIEPPKMTTEITIWRRLLRWIGVSQPGESEQEPEKAGNFNILRNPWHLKLTQEGLILVASRCFENVWALDSSSAEVTEFQFQDPHVVSDEFFRKAIDVKEIENVHSLVLQEMKGNKSKAENPWQISAVTDIISRVVRLHNKLFFIDTESQLIRKYDLDTGSHGILHLSNLGLLGFPSWWSLRSPSFQSPNLLINGDTLGKSIEGEADKLEHSINIQPGRCLLCINPVLPRGTVLAAPVEDGSIWRQAKGSIVELSIFGGSLISHKISSAQQWIDDLDDLEPDTQETEELTLPLKSESGIPFYSLLDASLGTGEVTIDAVLYLKYARHQESSCVSGPSEGIDIQEWPSQWEDQIFLKQVHLKVRLEITTSAPEERTMDFEVPL
ncbi:unnamed protein product [Calypogeia fissa]